jgi:Mg-chelatase subunit ChlD
MYPRRPRAKSPAFLLTGALLTPTLLTPTLLAPIVLAPAVMAQGSAKPERQAGGGKADAKAASPVVVAFGEAATETLVHAYGEAPSWAMRALIMLSLGEDWHPAGSAMLVAALRDKDKRLRAFAVEQVLRTGTRVAAAIATPDLITELVDATSTRNDHAKARAAEALHKLLPEVAAKKPAEWRQWWNAERATYAAPAWTAREQQQTTGTVSQKLVERAFDLRDAGLQVVFVVDSTGSMQVAIDAARDAIDEVTAILAGVTDRLELGLVHYKDTGDLSGAASLLVPLTKDHKKVRDKLAKLTAGGGGDIPERVERGIEVALDKETGWDKEKNRMLLVIGDAPPHPEDEQALLALVKRAYEHPFVAGTGPVTGVPKKVLRPFVTSTIATNPSVKDAFAAIAKAGGGASVVMNLGGGGPGGGRGAQPADVGKGRRSAGQQIAEHVLLLSFGAGYEAQLKVFVDVFFTYRNAGAF